MTNGDLVFRAPGRFSRIQYWPGLAMCAFPQVVDNSQLKVLGDAMPRHGFAGLAWRGWLRSGRRC